MNIAFIGHGNVGGALVRALARHGHRIVIGVRDGGSASADALASQLDAVSVLPAAQAVAGSEMVFLATPFQAVEDALSGLPLRAELMQRGYRRAFAALIDEALAALQAAGIAPARVTPLPPERLPVVLRLPDWLFRIVAARMLRIDAKARSSMADDVAAGRRTEVDALSGEVVRLAQAHGLAAPLNARMVELLDGSWPAPPPRLTAAELWARMRAD